MEPKPGFPPSGGDTGEAHQVDQQPLPPAGAYAESVKAGLRGILLEGGKLANPWVTGWLLRVAVRVCQDNLDRSCPPQDGRRSRQTAYLLLYRIHRLEGPLLSGTKDQPL